jgi:hypothetical protein
LAPGIAVALGRSPALASNVLKILDLAPVGTTLAMLRIERAGSRRLERTMNLLGAVLTIFAIGLGLVFLLPVVGIGLALLLVFGCFFIWLLPILIIAASDRVTGAEKIAWILAIIFLSWFAWIFYFLLAPLRRPEPRYRYY